MGINLQVNLRLLSDLRSFDLGQTSEAKSDVGLKGGPDLPEPSQKKHVL